MALTDDMLDGCAVQFDPSKETTDDDVAALVLFADVEFTTPEAVEARKAEWQELFG
jgi:uncharacterized protein YecE (DUF72 family)